MTFNPTDQVEPAVDLGAAPPPLDGEWDIAAGQFFTLFRRDVHVVPEFDTTRAVEWLAALDYGFTHFTAMLTRHGLTVASLRRFVAAADVSSRQSDGTTIADQ